VFELMQQRLRRYFKPQLSFCCLAGDPMKQRSHLQTRVCLMQARVAYTGGYSRAPA
jgi:hypothetical protein